MTHISKPVGNEITCIMHGIDDAVLNNVEKIEKDLLDAAAQEDFEILKTASYAFHPQGFTAILLLGESHIAIHTYPEYKCLVFNLYSCRGPEDGRKTLEYFRKQLNPSKVDIKEKRIKIDSKE